MEEVVVAAPFPDVNGFKNKRKTHETTLGLLTVQKIGPIQL